MKIMHVNRTLNVGGIEKLLASLSEYTDKKNAELSFLLLDNHDFDLDAEVKDRGCKITKQKRLGRYNKIGLFLQCYHVFRKEKPDVVHSHMCYDSLFIILAAKFSGVKTRIIHAHSAGFNKTNLIWKACNKVRQKMMMGAATGLLACSREAGQALFGKKAKFQIIPNGIDLSKFKYDLKSREKLRKEFGLTEKDILVGHVGRLDTPKNHEFLLDIFQKMQNCSNQKCRLAIVGDGPLRKTLDDRARQLGIEKQVLFLGNRDDVARLYSAFDMIIFPSIFEGLPISLVEAQANGLPILASDAISGEIALSDNIKFFSLDNSADDWAKMATTLSRQEADFNRLRNFSIENTIDELQKVYRRDRK